MLLTPPSVDAPTSENDPALMAAVPMGDPAPSLKGPSMVLRPHHFPTQAWPFGALSCPEAETPSTCKTATLPLRIHFAPEHGNLPTQHSHFRALRLECVQNPAQESSLFKLSLSESFHLRLDLQKPSRYPCLPLSFSDPKSKIHQQSVMARQWKCIQNPITWVSRTHCLNPVPGPSPHPSG